VQDARSESEMDGASNNDSTMKKKRRKIREVEWDM
jgi:hypothetical protein